MVDERDAEDESGERAHADRGATGPRARRKSATSLGRSRRMAARAAARRRAARDEADRAEEVEDEQPRTSSPSGPYGGPLPTFALRGDRPAPAAADRDDRGRQLDARPRGGARTRRTARSPTRSGPTRASSTSTTSAPDELMLRATHGTGGRRDDAPAAATHGRRDRRHRSRGARADHAPREGAPRPALEGQPEPAGARIRVDPRRADPRAREAGGRARTSARGAAEFRAGRDRATGRDRRAGSVSLEHATLYAEAQRRVAELEALARISEAVSESLYLEESLEAIVKTTMEAVSATGAAIVLEDGPIAWPEGEPARTPCGCRCAGSGGRSASSSADRDGPFTDEERAAARVDRAPRRGRARARPSGDARVLAQEIHHRVKNNLQTVASLLRLQARGATGVDPHRALEDSVNRILAIAAVHEVLTERREDDVDLGELLERLRAMLVQGLGGASTSRAAIEPVSLAGTRATALALVFSRAAAERARARRRDGPGRAARGETATSCWRSPTTVAASSGEPQEHGLSIVRRARPGRARRNARRSPSDAGSGPRSSSRPDGRPSRVTRRSVERRRELQAVIARSAEPDQAYHHPRPSPTENAPPPLQGCSISQFDSEPTGATARTSSRPGRRTSSSCYAAERVLGRREQVPIASRPPPPYPLPPPPPPPPPPPLSPPPSRLASGYCSHSVLQRMESRFR